MHTIKTPARFFTFSALFLLFLLPLSSTAFGQRSKGKSKVANKPLHWGVSVGLDYTRLRFEFSDWEDNGLATELGDVVASKGVGVTLGGQINLNFNATWALRLQPQVSFAQKQLTYRLVNNSTKQFDHQLTGLELPLDLVYRFFPKKISPVVLFGGWFRSNLGADRVPEIQLARSELGMNLGFGLEFNSKKYTVRPELNVSVGLKNGLKTESVFKNAKSIEAIYRDRISLKLNFMR